MFMVISFFIGVYYLTAHPKLTPNFLKFAQDFVIEPKEGSAMLFILSIAVMIIACLFVALKPQAKIRLTSEELLPRKEQNGVNGT
ncbi:MAG: hypothetical protein ACP5JH_10870 [Bacteroidota bacterium]